MGFLKVLFCFMIILVMLNSSVFGQYPPHFPNMNLMKQISLENNRKLQYLIDEVFNRNKQSTAPQYQPPNNQRERFGTYNPVSYNPQYQRFRDQPGIPDNFNNHRTLPQYKTPIYKPESFNNYSPASNNFQNQPPSNQRERFVPNSPGPSNPKYIGQPGNFNNYSTQNGFPQVLKNPKYQATRYQPDNSVKYKNPQSSNSPPYQSSSYQPENFGSIPNNPQYESFNNQPGGSKTDSSDSHISPKRSPDQYSGSINGYNSDLNTPQDQPPNDTSETVVPKETELDGPPFKSKSGERENTETEKTVPKRRSPNGNRRVFRTHGGHRNGPRPPSSIRYPVKGSTFTHPRGSPSNHSFSSHFSSGPPPRQVYRNNNAKPISPPPPPDDDPLMGHRIVCLFNNKHYYRNEFSPAYIDATLCTHLNYEFAILDPKSYEMIPGEPSLDIQLNFFQMACNQRKFNPHLKVLISLGGWKDSTEKYAIMAGDKEKRKNFVATTVIFIKKHGFDGMDLAWEYPNCWQGAMGISPKDKQNFVLLLKELFTEFVKRRLLLSISVGAVKREIDAAYDVREISKYVHFINVMTYDMHGPWESKTGHHTQFEMRPGDEDPYGNVKSAMNVWADKGADKKKLNMGIALYGKTFTLADPNQNGMDAPVTGIGDTYVDKVEGGFILYNHMCQWLNSGNWTEKQDKQAGFYAYCDDQWACYDSPVMVARKAEYVMNAGFGGVLMKDMGGDDYGGDCFSMPFPLVKMARFVMLKKVMYWKREKFSHHGW